MSNFLGMVAFVAMLIAGIAGDFVAMVLAFAAFIALMIYRAQSGRDWLR